MSVRTRVSTRMALPPQEGQQQQQQHQRQRQRQRQRPIFGGGDGAVDGFDVDDQEGEGMEALQLGNDAFRDGEYDLAIKAFSEALQLQPADPAILLSNRCASFCRLSQQLRKIPAETSEENALFGLDPMSLVQVALKDAEKLLKLRPKWPKAFLRKGTALLLLEQYELAKDTFLDGLQLDPASKALQAALRDLSAEFGEQLEQMEQTKRLKRSIVQRSDDLDCTICLKLLYNPITTPCGHSFCRACLLQTMDYGNKCPVCRIVLFVSPRTYPVRYHDSLNFLTFFLLLVPEYGQLSRS